LISKGGVLGSQGHSGFNIPAQQGELVLSIVEGNPLGDASSITEKPRLRSGLFAFGKIDGIYSMRRF